MGWCDRAPIAALLSLTLFASGCSGGSIFGGPSTATPSPPPAASSSPSLKEKVSDFFSGSSAKSPQPVANAQPDVSCPLIDIRDGASTLSIGPAGDNAAMELKYQGTFVRAARECAVVNGQMVMKVGVEGRVIVGPAGGPGQIEIPLRLAVVRETTAGSKTIVTKFVRIPVTIQSSTDNPTFTHIEDALAFPMPSPTSDLDNYVVYIGFDPLAAQAAERPKEKPKRKPKPKPNPAAPTG